MRKSIRLSLGFAGLAAVLSASQGLAEDKVIKEETRTTTTTTQGTVSQVGPNSIVIKSMSSPNPVTYTQTRTTTYVDENGNPVSIETVKSGIPVTVYYDKAGDQMTATKVVVQKRTVKEDD